MEVHDIVQETRIKTIPMEKQCKKAKWLSEEGLKIAVKRRKVKSKGERERYSLLFTWGQTMVEVMKIMVTSLKRFHACIATLSAPNPAADHRWPMPPRDAQTQFCLSLCRDPGSCCTQGLFEPSEHLWQEWGLILNVNSHLLSEIKLPTSTGSLQTQEGSIKTSIFALLTMTKPWLCGSQ